jgi:hypothetical protein
MLKRLLAWRIQEEAFGGLSLAATKHLKIETNSVSEGASHYWMDLAVKPGTTLTVKWAGKQHCIEVLEVGFIWRGRRFVTLAEAASAITGGQRPQQDLFNGVETAS